jgi:hypothetical protein
LGSMEAAMKSHRRTILIWVFGLLASALFFGTLGQHIAPDYRSDLPLMMTLAGMFAFACIRLWVKEG